MSLLSDPALRQLFEEEAETCLAAIERRLPDADEPEAAEILRRSAHTLKGSAGMMGLTSVRDIAEALEAVLAALAPGGRELTPGLRDAILAAVADLRHLVSNLLHGLDPGRAAQDIEQGLRALLAPAEPVAAHAAPADDLLHLIARAQLATLGLLADHFGLDPAAIPEHAGLAAALGAPAAAPRPRAAVLVADDFVKDAADLEGLVASVRRVAGRPA